MKRPKLGDEIEKPCSYIIHFDAPKAYRRGIFDLVGNYPVPSCDPFPQHDILYRDYGNSGAFEVCECDCHQHAELFESAPAGNGLPERYKTLKLIGFVPDLYYFMFMLSTDFGPRNWKSLLQPERWLQYREENGIDS